MPQIVNCPQCEKKLNVPDALLGKAVKCPTCGATFTAGGAAPPPEEEPLPSRRSAVRRPAPEPEPPPEDEYEDEPEDEVDDRPRRRRRRRGFEKPHRGSTIMTMGILSIFVAQLILGPITWVMGNNDLREMQAGRMDRSGESQTRTGRMCGMIATFLGIGLLLCGCVFGIIGAIGGAARGPGGPGGPGGFPR